MSVLKNFKSAPARGNRQGSGNSKDHVFGQVVGYELKDPRGMSSDQDDVMVVALFRDALNLKAEHDQDGTLLTHIKVALKPQSSSGSYVPMTIAEMKRGRGNAKETKPGDFVMFKDVEAGSNGVYRARRVDGAVRGFDPERNAILSGPSTVYRERKIETPERTFYTQDGVTVLHEGGAGVDSVEMLAEALKGAIEYANSYPKVRPQFLFRVLEVQDNKVQDVIHRTGGLAWDATSKTTLGVDESVEQFLARDNVKEILPLLENPPEGSQLIFEVVPMVGFRITGDSLPSKRKVSYQDKADKAGKALLESEAWKWDDSQNYRFRDEDGQWQSGFADTDVVLSRKIDSDSNEESSSYKIFLERSHVYGGLFLPGEVITTFLKEQYPEVAADLETRAQERAKARANANKAEPAEPQNDESYAPGMA